MAWDTATFRASFPAFANTSIYTDQQIEVWHQMAACSLHTTPCHGDQCYDMALMLMVAHIGTLLGSAARGQNMTGVVSASTIDKVSVSFSVPPYVSGWNYWLGLTPYGQQLLAMLSTCAIGGFYAIGRPESSAFRKVGGWF